MTIETTEKEDLLVFVEPRSKKPVRVIQDQLGEDGRLRLVLGDEWTLDYLNVRKGVTDIVLSPKK